MTKRPTCVEDECDNTVESDQVELIDVPVEDTGEWVETGETTDDYGEITEWTGEWQTIQYGICAACREREQQLFEELSVE